MTFRERILKVFQRRPADRIPFQPRIETWYDSRVKGLYGGMPERYQGMSLFDVYDDLGCSPRPYRQFNPCLVIEHSDRVKYERHTKGLTTREHYSTPIGNLEMSWRKEPVGRTIESWFIKKPEDMKVMEYVLKAQMPRFDLTRFSHAESELGQRAEPTLYVPRVNIMRLIVNWMGFEPSVFALADAPTQVESLLSAIDDSDDAIMRIVAESPVRIIDFGDNIDSNLVSPVQFKRYILPAYHRRMAILGPAKKFCHSHFDGSLKALLPFFQETRLDGLEGITPKPQGDVMIEKIRENMDNMILLDGIPMLLFLPNSELKELETFTRRLIDLFAPNLILGVADEVSPTCDIERVRFIADLVRDFAPHI